MGDSPRTVSKMAYSDDPIGGVHRFVVLIDGCLVQRRTGEFLMSEPIKQHSPSRKFSRYNYAFGPVVAGLILDAVDIVTFGPVGLALGFPIGAAAGYWLARSLRLETNVSLICALIAGVYCTIPGTELLPLGTLVGALVRLEDVPEPPSNETLVGDAPVAEQVREDDTIMPS